MVHRFTDQARRALAHAEEAARSLNHEYVGTEHILLGLMQAKAGLVAITLTKFGADANHIRNEIERLVHVGRRPLTQHKLPLTPRAKLALAFAEEESWMMHQDRIGPEHLIVGLLREPDGIAGEVLRNLGLSLPAVAKCVFAARLSQLEFVELIVRPISAGTARKRKMREELLAHLTAITDEELARHADLEVAARAAIERFGEPRELTRELQNALPLHERISYFLEQWIGWRAPETATQWMGRLATLMAALLMGLNIAATGFVIAELGWNANAWVAMRPMLAMSLLLPIAQFALGVLYYKVRDSAFGVFGSRKSRLRARSLAAVMGLVAFLTGTSFIALAYGDLSKVRELLIPCSVAGIATPFIILLVARSNGPIEIRDTVWALLDVEKPPHDDSTFEPA